MKPLKIIGAEADKSDEIVGYTTAGEPLTKHEYCKRLEVAEQQIKDGEYYTTDQIKQLLKDWEKKFRRSQSKQLISPNPKKQVAHAQFMGVFRLIISLIPIFGGNF